jgi:hypothetical protein
MRSDFRPSTVAGTKEAAALRDFDPADVRFGSQADMTARQVQVRFAPENGQRADRLDTSPKAAVSRRSNRCN